MTTEPQPTIGSLWVSRANTSGDLGRFVVERFFTRVYEPDQGPVRMVGLERDDGALFNVTLETLLADFRPNQW